MHRRLPIFYSALMLTAVNLLLRFVSTSFQVYISGKIGAAGIGLLQLVMSVGSMAMTAGMAGVRTATMYLTAEELGRKKPENVKWILSDSFRYSILISGCIATALTVFASKLAQQWIGDERTAPAIRLFAAFLPVSCLCGVMSGYFTAANRIGTLAMVEIAEQLCSMAATMTILNIWAGQDSAKACESIILGSGISTCFTLCCLLYLRIKERAPNCPRIPVRSRLLQAAVPLALADDLKTGINTVENLMVPKRLVLFSGLQDPLAAFGTVCGMVFPVLMFPAAILYGLAELLIPELARCAAANSKARIGYLVSKSLRVSILYGCLFCGILFLISKSLCIALYQSNTAGTHLQLYSLLIPMLYCDAITDAMTKGLGQQKICVRYNILTSCMDVLLLFILLPKWGMTGYFISFFITHFLNFILSLRRLLRISNCKIRIRFIILTTLSTVAAIWIASHVTAPVASAISFTIIWFCLLFLWGVLNKADLLWLKGLVNI